MTKQDFLGVSVEILKASCDQMDDVKAAFRYRSELAIYRRLNKGTFQKKKPKIGGRFLLDFKSNFYWTLSLIGILSG